MAATQVELTYGPIMVGIMLNVLLYGIMITQTYLYMVTSKQDKLWMKCFVYLLFLADTLNTCFDITFLYRRLVHQFGDEAAAMTANWVFNTDPALTGIIAFAVQSFFAWRVKLLTGSYAVTILILFCSTIQMLSGIATAVACGIVTQFVEFQKFKVVVILWLAFAALCDVIIAISLVWHLRGQRTGFAATDDIIKKLTRTTVQTGAITAVFATIDLITFVSSTSGLHLAFNMPLAKLYSNSVLSSLNARVINQASEGFMSSESRGQRPAVQRLQQENAPSRKNPIDIKYTPGQGQASTIRMTSFVRTSLERDSETKQSAAHAFDSEDVDKAQQV